MTAAQCMINLNADRDLPGVELCGEPPVYRAWIGGCSICWFSDFPECAGHPVCVKHGAELRVERLRDCSETASLVRLCSLEGSRS